METPPMIIRPVAGEDFALLDRLARKSASGLTTLPSERRLLQKKIEDSYAAFSAKRTAPADDHYLLVLVNSANGAVVGTAGIIAAVGVSEAFYSYKLGTVVHASRELSVYNKMTTLYLSNDYTGCCELCTLYLEPEYRRDNNGKLLSKSRFLLMAQFRERFASKVIAELRGYSDEKGRSPFWEGLGRHFFSMDFSRADVLSGSGNKTFIAELMPKHPVYVNLLDEDARNAISKVHQETLPALAMLKKEGFEFQGYVDIFDAGPTVEAPLKNIRTIRSSRLMTVSGTRQTTATGSWHLIGNTKLKEFRCGLIQMPESDGDRLPVREEVMEQLLIKEGDPVRIVSLA